MRGSLSTSDLAARIAGCEDKETAIAVLAGIIADSGATYGFLYNFNYGVKSAAERWTPLFSTFPAEISSYYSVMRCATEDPYMRAALSSTAPVRFLDVEDGLEPCGAISGLFALLRANGLADGLAMHVSDKPGRLTYFCLAFDHAIEDMSEFERRRIQACAEMFMHYAGDLLEPESARELSPKEREVVACLARGESNKEIARRLGLSISTVNTLVNRSFAKLGVNNRTEAAIAACRTGLSLVA
ncbi:LuxR C-terminal-related transcriptional regulator [Hyphococcus sp.]|jgi:DNA-binding CsgD family transcriptional regulator|uniref:helix-turn-helix transcriptional regulator n=1 Tax=Hyphococcus sp. TaxID=2038636 RepID=UPI003D152ED0